MTYAVTLEAAMKTVMLPAFPFIKSVDLDWEGKRVIARGAEGRFEISDLPWSELELESLNATAIAKGFDDLLSDLNIRLAPSLGMFGIHINRYGRVYTR